MAEAMKDFPEKQNPECPVCFQPYNNSMQKPKILPCGHSFCLGCLGNIKKSTNSIMCPKDRKHFKIPGGSVDKFPNNFTVLEIVTNLCDDCGGQPKQQVCLEEHCSMSLCDGCRENHCQSLHSSLRVALTDLKREAAMIDDDGDIVQLEDNAEAAIAEVTKLCDELKHSLIEEIKESKEKSIEAYCEWKLAISISATECRLNAQKLLAQIGTTYKSNKPDKVLADAQRQITEMETKLVEKEDSKPTLPKLKTETLRNEFDEFLLKLHLVVKPQPDITKEGSLMMLDQASCFQSRSTTQHTRGTTKPDYTRATLHTTYGTEGSKEGEFHFPMGISVSPVSNQVAVVDMNNHRIHLLTDSLTPVSVFGEGGKGDNQYSYPWDVTITDRGVMLITDRYLHRVHATDSSGIFLYMFGSEGPGQDQFRYPTGIASTHDHLYICDSNNYRVKVTLHDGTYVREFAIQNCFGAMRYIAVSEALDKAVISDQSGNIYMFTLTGQFMRMIKSEQPPLNIDATGLAFDTQGNLIAADHRGKQLVVLGEEDQLIATTGSGLLGAPRGVALTLSGDIVVCDLGEHCVKLIKVPQIK